MEFSLILKLIGCALVIMSSTGIGYLYGGEITRRQEDLKAAKAIGVLLRGDIRYAQTTLPEAIDNASKRHEGRLQPFLTCVADQLKKYSGESFLEIWTLAMKEQLKNTSLNNKDKGCLLQLGENLGYLDKDMQLNTIDWYIEQVEEQQKEIAGFAKEKIRLYRGLGILFGIFVTIVIL